MRHNDMHFVTLAETRIEQNRTFIKPKVTQNSSAQKFIAKVDFLSFLKSDIFEDLHIVKSALFS